MSFLLPAFHVGQAMLASYTALLSYTSIVKLNTYDEVSKKAAGYSNTAEHQLHKTQYTMAAGALATLFSLVSPIAFLVILPRTESGLLLAVSIANTAATMSAQIYISNFWKGKAKIPGVTNFNDSINTVNAMMQALWYLAITWGIADNIYGYQWLNN